LDKDERTNLREYAEVDWQDSMNNRTWMTFSSLVGNWKDCAAAVSVARKSV
jgi:hypothetical protein